jgi:hypothetical protein
MIGKPTKPSTVPVIAVHSQMGGNASNAYRPTASTQNATNHSPVPTYTSGGRANSRSGSGGGDFCVSIRALGFPTSDT